VAGEGLIDDFRADIALATNGADRLQGAVTVRAEDAGYRLGADLTGDLAPVLAPELVDFFGTEVGLTLDAWRSAAGRTVIDRFDVSARSLALSGSAEIASDGLPVRIDVTGTLAAPDGAPVALPFVADTRVSRADFRLTSTRAWPRQTRDWPMRWVRRCQPRCGFTCWRGQGPCN
jgi:translocation and assembly module TamB